MRAGVQGSGNHGSVLDRDLAALDVIVDHATGSQLERSILKRKFRKHIRQFGFQHLYDHFQYDWRFRLASARIYLGDYSNWTGWIYRDESAAIRYWRPTTIPRWQGQNVDRLFIAGEQGLGDEILWASVIPEAMLRCKQVTYGCDARLVSILERSLPSLRCVVRSDQGDPGGEFDAFIPAADLLPMFRMARAHWPGRDYLRPLASRLSEMERYRGRVGVGWAGRQGSVNPERLDIAAPLSLQHSFSWPRIEDPALDLKDDIEGVLALVSVLDRVVCVPSSIYHIAGAAGVRVDMVAADIAGEIENQVNWSAPPGKIPWYPDVTMHKSIDGYLQAQRSRPQRVAAG